MLIGSYTSTLSLKRRTAIPKKFLEILGKDLILAKWYEQCLVIVDKKVWIALLNKLSGKAEIATKPVRDTDRFILGSAYEIEPDSQGRIILPTNLVEYAGLKENLIFLGLKDRVEVWNKDVWEEKEKEISANASLYIEKIANETK